MAFDATAQGNWGCLPEHYPAVVDSCCRGRVALEPFIERRPLAVHQRRRSPSCTTAASRGRIVLIPEA